MKELLNWLQEDYPGHTFTFVGQDNEKFEFTVDGRLIEVKYIDLIIELDESGRLDLDYELFHRHIKKEVE